MLSALFHAHKLKPAWCAGLVFVLLCICTVAGYRYASHLEHARIAHAFHELATLKCQRVLLRVDGYARTLLDLRGLFVADPNVTNEVFQRFLQGVEVLQRYPALLHIGYAPRTTEANRVHLEGRLRDLGLSDAQPSPGDFPILYNFPTIGWMLGERLNSGPSRTEALAMARDANQPQLSPQLQLRLDRERRSGFVMYVPLYGDGLAPPAVAQRREALSGYLFVAFRTDDLIESTIGPDLRKHMSLDLQDGPVADAGGSGYISHYGFSSSGGNAWRYISTHHAAVNGRTWTFVFAAQPAFVLATQSNLPLVVLVGGLLGSILAAQLGFVAAQRWAAEGALRYLAFHDELTGLPNRAQLRSCIQEAILHQQKTNQPCALLIVELIRFSDINYTLGHPIGDEVLKQASARLRSVVDDEAATVARISNIQFGVLLPNSSQGAAVDVAMRLVAAMEAPLPAGDSEYELGARAGIASAPCDTELPDDLVRHADIALNRARTSCAAYVVYDPAHDPYKPQRLALLGAFRHAIKENQLEMYCQPKANLRTGRITSVEALVRWQHPDYGLIMPDRFISLIEPTELIQLLTQRMLECALRQSYEWRLKDLFLPLAVNLSTRNLLNSALPEMIGALMTTWGADATWLGLEITESSIMADPASSLRVLNQLHTMGHELIVDDFGTGHSSLSYLMKLPVAVLKIDQSFITAMLRDPAAAAIVKTIIELAHNMGLKVVAEGTETKEAWDALRRLDCDEAQGYYISPPLPAHELIGWLHRSPWQLAPA